MKTILILLSTITLFAWDKFYPSFHAKVINVAKNDVLNVRAKPNYKAKKLGSLEVGEEVQVEYCLESPKSTWCKIYPSVGINLGVPLAPSGYVNAKFLQFMNQGYVNIKNRKSDCDYLVECKNNKCLILSYEGLEWIKRSLIGVEKGQKKTSLPQDPQASGIVDSAMFCFYHARDKKLWKKVDDYYKHHKIKKSPKIEAIKIINSIKNCNINRFKSYLHPKKSLILSYFPHFYSKKHYITKRRLKRYYYSRAKFYWGRSEASNKKIYLSIKSFCKKLSKTAQKTQKVYKINTQKLGLYDTNLVAYEAKFYRDTMGWEGVIVVLEKYKNRWYLRALAYDNWES